MPSQNEITETSSTALLINCLKYSLS